MVAVAATIAPRTLNRLCIIYVSCPGSEGNVHPENQTARLRHREEVLAEEVPGRTRSRRRSGTQDLGIGPAVVRPQRQVATTDGERSRGGTELPGKIRRQVDRRCKLPEPDEIALLVVGVVHVGERDRGYLTVPVHRDERTVAAEHLLLAGDLRAANRELAGAEGTIPELRRVVVDAEAALPIELTGKLDHVEEGERRAEVALVRGQTLARILRRGGDERTGNVFTSIIHRAAL